MLNLEFNLIILLVRHRVTNANLAIAHPMVGSFLITCICIVYRCKKLA